MTLAAATSPAKTREPELDDLSLARARRGDAAACRALVKRYQRPVFALCSRMLGPAGRGALVEDTAQETFLRVFRALPGFKPGGSARLSTWILTLATRVCIDELRKRPPPDALPDVVVARERADAGLEARLLGDVLGRALSSLPADQRAVFLLRAYHELSYEEIAAAVSIEVGTVKSRLSRAKAALQRSLAEVAS